MDIENNTIILLPGETITIKTAQHGASIEVNEDYPNVIVKALPFDAERQMTFDPGKPIIPSLPKDREG